MVYTTRVEINIWEIIATEISRFKPFERDSNKKETFLCHIPKLCIMMSLLRVIESEVD